MSYTQVEIDQKKEAILAAYPHSRTWPGTVRKMKPEQVIRVYKELQERGKLR